MIGGTCPICKREWRDCPHSHGEVARYKEQHNFAGLLIRALRDPKVLAALRQAIAEEKR